MFRLKKWPPWAAVIAGVVMLGTASPARADTELMLTLTDGSGDSATATYDFTTKSWVNSNGSSGNGFGFSGSFSESGSASGNQILQFYGELGGYSVMVSTSTSNAPGGINAFVNTSNSSVTGSGSGLAIETSAETFTSPSSPPAPAVELTASSSTTGFNDNATTSANYAAYAGTSLGGSQIASVNGSYTIDSGGTGNGLPINSNPLTNVSSYSLTSIVSINGGAIDLSNINARAEMVALPEPTNMMAALSAVPFLALGAWLRRRKQVAIA
jgi:hypothetical protein